MNLQKKRKKKSIKKSYWSYDLQNYVKQLFFFIILKEFREVALGLFFFKDEKKNQSFIVVCFHGLFKKKKTNQKGGGGGEAGGVLHESC